MIVFDASSAYRALVSRDHSTKLIVIVDDDESVQSALQDLIEADGLSARCFGSAEKFLESGLQRKAACLITDIRMPECLVWNSRRGFEWMDVRFRSSSSPPMEMQECEYKRCERVRSSS